MDDKPHKFECRVNWQRDLLGAAEAAGRAPIAIGAPPEFGGANDVWSPEHLAAAAINACTMLTFVAIAKNSKLEFLGYSSSAEVTVQRTEDGALAITDVTVRPRVTIPPTVDAGKVERILRMAERNCVISNSITATVTLEPEIVSES